jgi:hypothetical protein
MAGVVDHMMPVRLAGRGEALAVAGGGAVTAFKAQAAELSTEEPREPSRRGGRRVLARLEHGSEKGLPYVSALRLQSSRPGLKLEKPSFLCERHQTRKLCSRVSTCSKFSRRLCTEAEL